MSIPVQCNGCHRQFKVKDRLAEKRVRCPWCSIRLFVPEGPSIPSTPPPPKTPTPAGEKEMVRGAFRVCPLCAERVRAQARKCRYCGEEMPALSREGMKEGTISLWDVLTEGELAAIEEGRRSPDGKTGEPDRDKQVRTPAQRRSRRRVKRYLRELARLGKWARISEFKEVRQAVKKSRQALMERLHGVLDEAKKEGALEEHVTWDGEVRFRFVGEEDTWSVPIDRE